MAKKSKQVKTWVTDTIREVLNEAEINYEFHAEDNVFTFILSCENTDLNMVIHADDEGEWFRCYAALPVRFPKERFAELLFTVNTINLQRTAACLRLNPESGIISASMLVNVDDGCIGPKMFLCNMHEVVRLLDEEVPELMRVVYADLSSSQFPDYNIFDDTHTEN